MTGIDSFIRDGFLKLENAFSAELAAECREILWRDTGCDANDRATWNRPVIRLGFYQQLPFVQAANTPALHQAFDQLAGPGHWSPRANLGTFPVRFPSAEDPGDTGWHIDASFAPEPGQSGNPNDYFEWRVNIRSRGRALLLLFLFSDTGLDDAPTRIRTGSHLDMARRLFPAREDGLSLRELAMNGFAESAGRAEIAATGTAGTVYLCHPFLVHAAQPHRGIHPRFLAQPPLPPGEPYRLDRPEGRYSPVEQAIREALQA